MQQVEIKVKHRRFLNVNDFEKLQSHKINARLNNAVYGEYTAHMTTKIVLETDEIEKIKSMFKISKFEKDTDTLYIEVDMEK